MKCEQYQREIGDALAGGEAVRSAELAAHLRSCRSCREFHEAQRQLLGAIETGVRTMVNEAVPASLLRSVRTQMEAAPVGRISRRAAWRMAVVTVTVLAVTFGVMRHRREPNLARTNPGGPSLPGAAAVAAGPNTPGAGQMLVQKKQTVSRKAAAPSLEPSLGQRMEVIVLPEERKAFAKFMAELPKEKSVTAGLTRPVSEPENAPVEIALLHIQELKLELLEPSEEK